ncbi:MAG: DNA topoisomerase IB [Microbacteriaceae bacterium]|nr:DNA topoisomerase IB [Microbacteriaceae bacterium]
MPRRSRLVTVTPGEGGWTRKGAGRGFTYTAANGRRIADEAKLERIRALAIPPAWKQVWIATDPDAHIQATGVDEAGRTQYLYHPEWRAERDEAKFEKSLAFAATLPRLRRAVTRHLKPGATGDEAPRLRALAAAVRLIDRGSLRVGGSEQSGQLEAFGASTLQRRHVEVAGAAVHLRFRGKSGSEWDLVLDDAALAEFFGEAPKSPRTAPAVCYPVQQGRRREWRGVSAAEINDYLTDVAGLEFTAKDFRTWQGSVAAARALARAHRAGSTSPEAVTAAVEAAAELLRNTPAVARESYIDPRIIELFEQGCVVELRGQPDRALLRLLGGDAG